MMMPGVCKRPDIRGARGFRWHIGTILDTKLFAVLALCSNNRRYLNQRIAL